jgi:integrase
MERGTPILALTDLSLFHMLLEEDMKKQKKGAIRAKGKCPICGQPFCEIRKLGFVCPEHKTVPKRVYIDLSWKGERVRIFSDKTGTVLETYDQADTIRDNITQEIKNHTFDPSKYVREEAEKFWVRNLLDRFEEDKIDAIAPSYKKDYRRMVQIAKTFFGIQDVREIRKIHLINYKNHCQAAFKWKAKTLKNNMDLFRAFLNYLKSDLEVIDVVPSFPEIEILEPQFKWLGAKDQVALFEKVPDDDKPIIAFLMLHGCRPGEARALKCRDVDFENGAIRIAATFSKNIYREKRKGKRSRSVTIPIHPELYAWLEDRVKGNMPEAFVFINPRTGMPYSQEAMTRIWNNVRSAAKIKDGLRLYDASRHSFASQLVNAGTPLNKVSKLLGHSSTKMTEKYAHQHIDALRAEIANLSLKKETVTRLSPERKREV